MVHPFKEKEDSEHSFPTAGVLIVSTSTIVLCLHVSLIPHLVGIHR